LNSIQFLVTQVISSLGDVFAPSPVPIPTQPLLTYTHTEEVVLGWLAKQQYQIPL